MAGRDADTGGAGETGTLGLGAKVGGEETGCAASRFAALLCRRVRHDSDGDIAPHNIARKLHRLAHIHAAVAVVV